ncbi:MAG: hypothetical protein L6N94_00465 [Candidatus Methylarchaceae archaeon HK01M]|nr:hypothetical protein [Candidatus Methylarchaceae archaeon HK01M]
MREHFLIKSPYLGVDLAIVPDNGNATLTGHLSDRSRRRRLPIISSALGMATSFFLIPFTLGGSLILILIFLGLAAAFILHSVFALPLEMLHNRSVSWVSVS